MQISVKANFKALEREFGKLPITHQAKVIPAALNKAGAKGFTVAKREIAKALRIKQAEFTKGTRDRRMFLSKANSKRLSLQIVSVGRPFNLTRFGARAGGSGVVGTVMGRGRTVPGAFILPKAGLPAVRRSQTKGKMKSRKAGVNSQVTKHNQKLEQIWGASAADAMRIRPVTDPVVAMVTGELGIQYQRAIAHEMRRIRARLARSGRR